MKPYWINRFNFKCVSHNPPRYKRTWPFPWRRKELKEYTADPVNPPEFVDNRGQHWRFDNHLEETDGLSIPWIGQYIMGKSEWDDEPNGQAHDSVYRTGGAWKLVQVWSYDSEKPVDKWIFFPMKRSEADDMIHQMFDATDGREWVGDVVENALMVGGSFAWNEHAEQRKKEEQKRRGSNEKGDAGKSVGDSTNG